MKKILLNSAFLILISMTICQGASEEDSSGRPKRPLTPITDLSFLLSHTGEGVGGERVGSLQRQKSVPKPGFRSSQLFGGGPVGTCGLDDKLQERQNKKMREDSDHASNTGATGSTKDKIAPVLSLEKEPFPTVDVSKVSSIEVPRESADAALSSAKTTYKRRRGGKLIRK